MRSSIYEFKAVRSISPVAIGTTGTGQTGKIVDRRPTASGVTTNFRRVAIVFDYGTITATNAAFTVIVKEGDVTGTMTSVVSEVR